MITERIMCRFYGDSTALRPYGKPKKERHKYMIGFAEKQEIICPLIADMGKIKPPEKIKNCYGTVYQ